MSTNTPNYGLTKPAPSDRVDITVLDADLDTIDTTLKANADAITSLRVNVKNYGALGNGSADDSTAFQSAISAAATSVVYNGVTNSGKKSTALVYVPVGYYKLNSVTISNNVRLVCDGARLSPTAGATGPLITFTGSYSGVTGAYFAGNAVVGVSGVHFASGSYDNIVSDCRFDNFDGRAIYDEGVSQWISDVDAQNCLLSADSLSSYTGVIELAGTDTWLKNSASTSSRYPSRGMSASGKSCALAIVNANNMVDNHVSQTSDHGVYIGAGATQLNLVGVRGELCYGHGWIIDGGGGRIVNPMALRNSLGGNLTYNGFYATGAAPSRFIVVNAWSESYSAPTRQNYGIADGITNKSTYNRWINPIDVGSNVPCFSTNNTGTSFTFPDHPPANMTASTATPGVGASVSLLANNTSPITVTNFTQGVNGQKFFIRGDGYTSVANNSTITTITGATTLLVDSVWYRFVRIEGVWVQMS